MFNQDQEKERVLNCKIITGKVRVSNVTEFLSLLKSIAHKYAVTIQAMDAELIAGEAHIKSAVIKALRAVASKRNITNDLGLEILLYAAGKRQIERAFALVIVDATAEKDLAVVVDEVKRETKLEEAPISELDYIEAKKENLEKFFNITDAEINAVGEKKLKMLVLERVALLDVLK